VNWFIATLGGSLNWSAWFYGIVQAVIKGGATSASAGISVIVVDPDHFNLQTGKFWAVMGTSFVVGAATNFFSFLQNNPVPTQKTQTTMQTTTTTPSGVVTKTAMQQEITKPIVPPPAEPKP
jgi:hypothetical protein